MKQDITKNKSKLMKPIPELNKRPLSALHGASVAAWAVGRIRATEALLQTNLPMARWVLEKTRKKAGARIRQQLPRQVDERGLRAVSE